MSIDNYIDLTDDSCQVFESTLSVLYVDFSEINHCE